jgi:hypothetical protein
MAACVPTLKGPFERILKRFGFKLTSLGTNPPSSEDKICNIQMKALRGNGGYGFDTTLGSSCHQSNKASWKDTFVLRVSSSSEDMKHERSLRSRDMIIPLDQNMPDFLRKGKF